MPINMEMLVILDFQEADTTIDFNILSQTEAQETPIICLKPFFECWIRNLFICFTNFKQIYSSYNHLTCDEKMVKRSIITCTQTLW